MSRSQLGCRRIYEPLYLLVFTSIVLIHTRFDTQSFEYTVFLSSCAHAQRRRRRGDQQIRRLTGSRMCTIRRDRRWLPEYSRVSCMLDSCLSSECHYSCKGKPHSLFDSNPQNACNCLHRALGNWLWTPLPSSLSRAPVSLPPSSPLPFTNTLKRKCKHIRTHNHTYRPMLTSTHFHILSFSFSGWHVRSEVYNQLLIELWRQLCMCVRVCERERERVSASECMIERNREREREKLTSFLRFLRKVRCMMNPKQMNTFNTKFGYVQYLYLYTYMHSYLCIYVVYTYRPASTLAISLYVYVHGV